MPRRPRPAAPVAPGPETRPAPSWRRELLPLGSLLGLFAVLAGPYLVAVFDTWVPGGWDGVAHFAITEIYAERIFPRVSGWVPEYFGGMPFPDFYPPLFYWLVAGLITLGVPAKWAFLGFQTLLAVALPLLSYAGAKRLSGDRVAGWVAGALAVIFLADRQPVSSFGITLFATFGIGLATQLLGFVLVLAFYYFHLGAERNRRDAALASLCLGLVALTNVHVVWDAVFLFVGLAGARLVVARGAAARWGVLRREFAIGAGSLLVAALWLVPMLARLEYVPTMALDPPPLALVVLAFLRLAVYLVLSIFVARADRNHAALGLAGSMVLLLLAASVPAGGPLERLALQPGRFLIGFQFLSAFLVGYLVSAVGQLFPQRRARPIAALAVVLLFFAYSKPAREALGIVSPDQAADYQGVIEGLRGRSDGRVLVEMGGNAPSDAFGLQALVPRSGAPSLTTVFRESALNVMFAAPLRNSLSSRREFFGVQSKLPGTQVLQDQPAAAHLARLGLFNVRYVVLKDPDARARLQEKLAVTPLGSSAGRWAAFALKEPPGAFAQVPRFEPVLTFTRFSVKPRPDDGYDFVRLGEEMFAAARLETPLALAREGRIDHNGDWERFQVALVAEPRYENLEQALAALQRFATTRPVVFLDGPDPLVARLHQLAAAQPNLTAVRRATAAELAGYRVAAAEEIAAERKARRAEDPEAELPGPDQEAAEREARAVKKAVAATAGRLLDALDRVRVPVVGPAVEAANLVGERAAVKLTAPPAAPVPVWLSNGYLPGWESSAGAPVYLATPTFQLTWADHQDLTLEFRPQTPAKLGLGLSLLGLIGLAVWALWPSREP